MRRAAFILACLMLLAAPAAAQAPTCEDQLVTLQVFAERQTASRRTEEADAAQVIARFIRRTQALEAEVGRLRADVERLKAGGPEKGK